MKHFGIWLLLGMLLCTSACAMTEADMLAIYQESFDKMGTTANVNIMTAEELEAFEEEYTRNTGFERKDDLIVSTLPSPEDMPYEEALAYARKLVLETFGTPESELDAMGVYPRLMDYVYMQNESEWEFFFTPLRDTDIELDHFYPAPGEYRVHFGAQTGTVQLCNWYIDDFWPEYARRTWEAGKRDEVYRRAQRKDFYSQNQVDQAYFIELFKEAGYDVSFAEKTREELLASMRTDLHFIDTEHSVLHVDDKFVKNALAALEKEYGLTLEMLDKHAFAASFSPMQMDTLDLCFAYNYSIESAMYDSGKLNQYTGRLFSYVSRLGVFMVSMDPKTGDIVCVTHVERGPQAVQALDETLLLGRRSWTAADLPEFDALLHKLDALTREELAKPQPDYDRLNALTDTLMREAGGDPELYYGGLPDNAALSPEEAGKIAFAAALEASGMTQEAFEAHYAKPDVHMHIYTHYTVYMHSMTADQPDGGIGVYQVDVDAQTGDVLRVELTNGVG